MRWAASVCPSEVVHRWIKFPPLDSHELRSSQHQFDAGQKCAHAALLQLRETGVVGLSRDQSPIWPQGFIGSIANSDHWAWAAVAPEDSLASIGTNTEPLLDKKVAEQFAIQLATYDEWKIMSQLGYDWPTAFAIMYSAKQSQHKCWSPITRQDFCFKHFKLIAADGRKLKFDNLQVQLLDASTIGHLDTFHFVDDRDVFSLTWMN